MSKSIRLILFTLVIIGQSSGRKSKYYMVPVESSEENSLYLSEKRNALEVPPSSSSSRAKPLYIEIPHRSSKMKWTKVSKKRKPKYIQWPKKVKRVHQIRIVPSNKMLKGVQLVYPSGEKVFYWPSSGQSKKGKAKPVWIKVKAFDPRFGVQKRFFPLQINVQAEGKKLKPINDFDGQTMTTVSTTRAFSLGIFTRTPIVSSRKSSPTSQVWQTVSQNSTSGVPLVSSIVPLTTPPSHKKLFNLFDNIYNDTRILLTNAKEESRKEVRPTILTNGQGQLPPSKLMGQGSKEFVWIRYRIVPKD